MRGGVARRSSSAHAAGASVTARKALGFEELLAGDVEAMKRHTRNYARRQLTWMRKLAGVQPLDLTDLSAEQAAEEILAMSGPRLSRRMLEHAGQTPSISSARIVGDLATAGRSTR